MRRLLFCLMLCLAPPLAQAQQQPQPPLQSEASHVAILDHDTGILLFCKNCETPMPPASMSKLMTALLVREKIEQGRLKFDTLLPVSEKAWRHGAQSDGSHMFLNINSQVAVRDLLEGVIVVSANDACIALAEGVSGSEEAFVREMNQRAKALGLSSATFANVTGLPDPRHVVSAQDLAKLTSHIIKTYPDLYAIYSKPDLTFNNRTQQNRNPLLGAFPGADGVKTGHTNASGYGLVGSAVQEGRRRIVVFNGMPSQAARAQEAQRLLRAAFLEFEALQLFAKGAQVGEAQVWLGSARSVPLVARDAILLGRHKSLDAGLTAQIVYQGPVAAPIKAGDPIGELVIQGPNFPPRRYPLVAGKAVGRLNVFGRAIAGAQSLFNGAQ
jgi:D-alanyl-D-alanine carboxypeptidase (penicillin-binding protein 5/6)